MVTLLKPAQIRFDRNLDARNPILIHWDHRPIFEEGEIKFEIVNPQWVDIDYDDQAEVDELDISTNGGSLFVDGFDIVPEPGDMDYKENFDITGLMVRTSSKELIFTISNVKVKSGQ